ncbi:MAG: hypothetical protein WC985_00725 [Thermoplasmata archaeon]
MNLTRRLLPMALVALLALTVFALPAGAQPAPLPTWTVGKAVGYGTDLDLTSLAQPFLQQIQANYASYNITSIQTLNFTGSLDAWTYQQVQSKTDTYYVLATQSAEGLKIHFAFNATFNNLPAPGTYTGSCTYGYFDGTVPLATRSVEVDLDLTSLSTADGTSRWATSDLALMQSTDNITAQVSAHAVLKGLPMVDVNLTACQETVTYEDRDVTLTVNTNDEVRELFSPALDVFDFPINPGEDWWANSTATVGATLSGTVNVIGLSAVDEQAFFENLTHAFQSVPGLAVTGLDHFPIDLAQITVTLGGTNYLQGGVLHDTPVPVAEHLQARESNMTLADGNFHEVFLISTYQDPSFGCPPTLYAVYSPDDGMIVGYQMYATCTTSLPPVFELKPVPPGEAQNNLQQTENNYNPFPQAPGNAIVDFFVAAPYWGILLLVTVAAAVAGFFLVGRRGRRMAPPMPPAPPPPTGP